MLSGREVQARAQTSSKWYPAGPTATQVSAPVEFPEIKI